MAFVPLTDAEALTREDKPGQLARRLADRVRARFGNGVNMVINTVGDTIIDIDGIAIAVMVVDRPLPPDAYERAIGLNPFWPEARPALAAQQAHAIVATLNAVAGHGQALNSAAYVTFVAAALLDLAGGALAVIWTGAEAIQPPAAFQQAADGLMDRRLPVLAWMSIAIIQGSPANGMPTFGAVTAGLAPFVGREIEFTPAAMMPSVVADRVIGAAQYLMLNGSVLNDGDTLGVNEQERIRVRHRQGTVIPAPVLALSAERV